MRVTYYRNYGRGGGRRADSDINRRRRLRERRVEVSPCLGSAYVVLPCFDKTRRQRRIDENATAVQKCRSSALDESVGVNDDRNRADNKERGKRKRILQGEINNTYLRNDFRYIPRESGVKEGTLRRQLRQCGRTAGKSTEALSCLNRLRQFELFR